MPRRVFSNPLRISPLRIDRCIGAPFRLARFDRLNSGSMSLTSRG
ncbi:hypothetical protein [Leptolyngbya ohadii]|nr:hypothetical protein [Leptolyngbya ohadii]